MRVNECSNTPLQNKTAMEAKAMKKCPYESIQPLAPAQNFIDQHLVTNGI